MEQSYSIRSMCWDDLESVQRLVLSIQQEEFSMPVTLEGQSDLVNPLAFFRRGRGNVWVAESAGVVIGVIGLQDLGNGAGQLRKMFVAAAWRGKEKGVAQDLLETLLVWASEHGICEILLGTIPILSAAIKFYRRNGFTPVGRSGLPAEFVPHQLDTVFMRRRQLALVS